MNYLSKMALPTETCEPEVNHNQDDPAYRLTRGPEVNWNQDGVYYNKDGTDLSHLDSKFKMTKMALQQHLNMMLIITKMAQREHVDRKVITV